MHDIVQHHQNLNAPGSKANIYSLNERILEKFFGVLTVTNTVIITTPSLGESDDLPSYNIIEALKGLGSTRKCKDLPRLIL